MSYRLLTQPTTVHPPLVVARFLQHVPVGLPDDVCWEWAGTRTKRGYGVFQIGHGATAKQYRAHRVAVEIATGRLLGDLDGCHRCDNPPCCNPICLFPGTHAENQHDKGRKGRAARGCDNQGGQKLTEDDVRAIRVAVAAGATYTETGRNFGVSRVAVSKIVHGKLWGWLT